MRTLHVVDRAVVVSVVRCRPRRGDSAEVEARAKCARWRVDIVLYGYTV